MRAHVTSTLRVFDGSSAGRGVVCGKHAYFSNSDAKRALRQRREFRTSRGFDGPDRDVEQRTYRCQTCGAWHLTSQSQTEYEIEQAWRLREVAA